MAEDSYCIITHLYDGTWDYAINNVGSISSYAKASVKEMQMTGLISGRKDNTFDPQGTATRAEVSAVLQRFVELIEVN